MIQNTGRSREPGPCYQCIHRQPSELSAKFPTCMVAEQRWNEQVCLVLPSGPSMYRWRAAKEARRNWASEKGGEKELAIGIQNTGLEREPGPCYQCLHRKKSTTNSQFLTCKVAADGNSRKWALNPCKYEYWPALTLICKASLKTIISVLRQSTSVKSRKLRLVTKLEYTFM